jgi:hypothetical protein
MSQQEKAEKQEKPEKRQESIEEKWARDPLGTAMGALVLIWLGVVLLVVNAGLFAGWVQWDNFWAYFLMGLGVIMVIEAIIRLIVPAFRGPVLGKILGGVILFLIGASATFITTFDWDRWWPVIPIAFGVAILLGGLFRRRK